MSKLDHITQSPHSHEFLVEPDGKLRHVRTGELVACFEVTGKLLNGKRFAQMYNGDKAGFQAMQLVPLHEGKRMARLTNGQPIEVKIKVN